MNLPTTVDGPSAIDRAVATLRASWDAGSPSAETGWMPPTWFDDAHALADAGLLVTDEMRAVLDAAIAHRAAPKGDWWRFDKELHAAVDAYLETIKEDQ